MAAGAAPSDLAPSTRRGPPRASPCSSSAPSWRGPGTACCRPPRASSRRTGWRRGPLPPIWHPALGAVRRELHRAVHRLHRGVGQERRAVDRLELLRGGLDGGGRISLRSGTQHSARSAESFTVQFIGSIVAWARNGVL